MDIKYKPSYAPFGSVANKSPKKRKNSPLLPGPGAYDISLPIITPIVQTIRKANNNVIVKLGHLGTAPFLAGGQRFKQQIEQDQIGPGAYSSIDMKKHNTIEVRKQRKYAAQKLRQLIKNPIDRSPTISQVKRVAFDDEIQMPNKKQNNASRLKQQNMKGVNWSRMSEERSSIVDKSAENKPGPGHYELPVLRERILSKSPSSAFSSNSIRSFLDQIVFETNQDEKARQRSQRKYKSDVVGPGAYNVEKQKLERLHKYQFFGSTQQRL